MLPSALAAGPLPRRRLLPSCALPLLLQPQRARQARHAAQRRMLLPLPASLRTLSALCTTWLLPIA